MPNLRPEFFGPDGKPVTWKTVNARQALWYTFSADHRRNFPRFDGWPSLEDCVLAWERQTEQAFTAILDAGGAGSSEAIEAHNEWMAARTLRVTMDALWPSVPAQGQGIAFRYETGLASNDGYHGMAY